MFEKWFLTQNCVNVKLVLILETLLCEPQMDFAYALWRTRYFSFALDKKILLFIRYSFLHGIIDEFICHGIYFNMCNLIFIIIYYLLCGDFNYNICIKNDDRL